MEQLILILIIILSVTFIVYKLSKSTKEGTCNYSCSCPDCSSCPSKIERKVNK